MTRKKDTDTEGAIEADEAGVRISGGQGADWLRAGGTLYLPLASQFGVFSVSAHVFSGRNTGRSARLNAGMVLKLYSRGRGGISIVLYHQAPVNSNLWIAQ